MNTCKNCKHWEFIDVGTVGLCNHPKVGQTGDNLTRDGLNVSDGEVITGPDFGCVHWKQK